jgi:hypothetical protein
MRWFEAFPGYSGAINYYKDDTRSKLLGTIPLTDATIKPLPSPDPDAWLFVIRTSKRAWELAALSPASRERWLTVLGYRTIPRADQYIMEAEEMMVQCQLQRDNSRNPFNAEFLPRVPHPDLLRVSPAAAAALAAAAEHECTDPLARAVWNGGSKRGRGGDGGGGGDDGAGPAVMVQAAPIPPQRRLSQVEIRSEGERGQRLARRLSGLDLPSTLVAREASAASNRSSSTKRKGPVGSGGGGEEGGATAAIEMCRTNHVPRIDSTTTTTNTPPQQQQHQNSFDLASSSIFGSPPPVPERKTTRTTGFGQLGAKGPGPVLTRPKAGVMGGGGAASVAAAIEQLAAMGFTDRIANLEALARHGGDVVAAIDSLVAAGGAAADAEFSFSSLGPDGKWRDYTLIQSAQIAKAMVPCSDGIVRLEGLPFEIRWGGAAISPRMPEMPKTKMIQVNTANGNTRVARCNGSRWPHNNGNDRAGSSALAALGVSPGGGGGGGADGAVGRVPVPPRRKDSCKSSTSTDPTSPTRSATYGGVAAPPLPTPPKRHSSSASGGGGGAITAAAAAGPLDKFGRPPPEPPPRTLSATP